MDIGASESDGRDNVVPTASTRFAAPRWLSVAVCAIILAFLLVIGREIARHNAEERAVVALGNRRAISVQRESPLPFFVAEFGIDPAWCQRVAEVMIIDSDFGDQDAAELAQLRRLRTVAICSDALTDQGVCELSGLRLREVALTSNRLTDRSAECLARMPTLECVVLESAGATDASVRTLAALPRLRELRMQLCPITNHALHALERHPTLEFIDVSFTSITQQGAEAFRRANPGIDVEFQE